MENVKIDRTKLMAPSAYAKKLGITPAAVTKMMNENRVKYVTVCGKRLIQLD